MNKSLRKDDLVAYLGATGLAAKSAANTLRLASNDQRTAAIRAMAKHVRGARETIITANAEDMRLGAQKGLSPALLDRLKLDAERIEGIASGLEAVAALPDPVGAEDERWTRPNGLTIAKVRTPIGVIGMIYESRPNVTADAASLCLKSGNACILRGGSEALRSNTAIHQALVKGLLEADLPEACVQYINTTDRDAVGHMLAGLNGSIDLIIPRGGKGLVGRVQSDARVPVLAHLEGLNHTYVHTNADPDMARDIVLNAKMRRTGICGSTETVLIDEAALPALPAILGALKDAGCVIKGDAKARAIDSSLETVTDADFRTEYLDAIINVKVVADIDEALTHIAEYGSGHTDAIITGSATAAHKFLSSVDSAIVLHNASTQYADGGEFGFGAEIGIATGKLHARGPVGAQHLTSYKYHVLGTGQTRP
jgi:glutamate-5-semialdehyde dehydrogenase